jgi:transcriptional regulator with XRE-family HTH domain
LTVSEPTSADDLSINRFPTAISESASTFTATLTAVRDHSTALLEGLATLSRIDRGDGARWREMLQKAQQIFTVGSTAEPLEANPEFGVLLRQRREQAGLTQQELAERAGVSTTWLRGIEAGRSRVSRRMMLKLMNLRELALTADHLAPAAGPTGQLSEPLNYWLAPHLDAVSMLQELKQRLSAPGGRVEQTYMYLDHQSAFDWWKIANDPQYLTAYRHPMPIEAVAARAIEVLGQGPVDLIALGPGDGQQETRFAQALISHQKERDLRVYLLDISQPLLSKAHRHAKDCLDAVRGVTVVGMFGNFHYLPLYEQIFYSPAKRRRIFSMLGATLNNLDDEPGFFRDALRCATRNDLLLADFTLAYAPPNQPERIRELDPALKHQMPESVCSWLSGPFYRNGNPRQVSGSYQLSVDCPVPGSYSIDSQLRVIEQSGQERKFIVWRVKRYEPEQLTDWLAQRGWQRIYFSQFGHHGRNQMGIMLLQKRD